MPTHFAESEPETILDLGANVGLAAAYFGHRFPNAAVVALEPSVTNLQMAALNTHR